MKRRWGVALHGAYSNHTTPITFVKFWRRRRAVLEANRLNLRMPTASHGDQVVRYVVFDYRTRKVSDG